MKAERDSKRRAYEQASPANEWQRSNLHTAHVAAHRGNERAEGDAGKQFGNGSRAQGAVVSHGDRCAPARGTNAPIQNPRQWQQANTVRMDQHVAAVPMPDAKRSDEEDNADPSSDSSLDLEEEARVAAQLLKSSPNRVVSKLSGATEGPPPDYKVGVVTRNTLESFEEQGLHASISQPLIRCSMPSREISDDEEEEEEADVGINSESDGGNDSEPEMLSVKHQESPANDLDMQPANFENTSHIKPVPFKKTCNAYMSGGKCRFGKRCAFSHVPSSEPFRKPQGPPPRPVNPFDRDDLLGKLLHNEIKHEMSDLVQVIDFLARNDWMTNVELYTGHKEEVESRIKVLQSKGEFGGKQFNA